MQAPALLLLIALLVPSLSTAEPDTSNLKFSPERLARLTDHIDDRIRQDKEAGIQLLVAHRGEQVLLHNAGLLHGDTPIADDSIFFTHSMMKPITSLAVMQLLEEGKILLSDPIADFLPEFRQLNVYVSGESKDIVTRPATRPMTILHLLTHTAGYTYDYGLKYSAVTGWYGENLDFKADLASLVTQMSKGPITHEPGTAWEYGPSTTVLARLVEVVTGESFSDYIQANIFKPLKMVDSGYTVTPENLHRAAARFYRDDTGKLQESDYDRTVFSTMPTYTGGDSGLFTTSTDYLRFCQMILNGGELEGAREAGPKTIELMTTNMVPWEFPKPIMPPGKGFTPGFSIYASKEQTQSMVSEGSVNWGGASGAVFWIDFQEELIVIMMTQSYPPHAPRSQTRLESLVYQALVD